MIGKKEKSIQTLYLHLSKKSTIRNFEGEAKNIVWIWKKTKRLMKHIIFWSIFMVLSFSQKTQVVTKLEYIMGLQE